MPNSLPSRPYLRARAPQPKPVRIRRRLATITGLGLAGLIAGLLSGCSLSSVTTAVAPPATGDATTSWAALKGNWGIAAASGAPVSATRLTSLGGSLAVNGSAITATLHALSPGQCLSPAELIALTGSVATDGSLSLSGQTGSGTIVRITGAVAADQHSLENPTLSATGGACTAAAPSPQTLASAHPRDTVGPTAQQYQPVSGTYAGTLTTADGESFSLTTTVTQLDQPDANGTYHLQGTASAPGNPCVPAAVTATASQLSGGVLSATYSDGNGTSITATGYASADATTVALTNWQITSSCGTDSGTATLTRQ